MVNNGEKRYLAVPEVARRFAVHEETVRIWLRDGWLHGVKIGGVWRVRPEDVEKMFEKEVESE